MNVRDFSEKWLLLKSRRLSPLTLASYRGELERNVLPFFGDKEINSISSVDVEMWLDDLLARAQAPETAKRSYAVFRSLMHKATVLGLCEANPARSEVIEPLPSCRKETEILSQDDLTAVLDAVKEEPLRWRGYVMSALETGARRGELVALRWKNIDFSSRIIIFDSSAYKLAGEKAGIKCTKNGKTKKVHVSMDLLRLLRSLQREQMRDCLRNGVPYDVAGFVFGKCGAMMHPTTPTGWWSKFQKRHSLKHYKLHALRHTMASYLLASGASLKTVSSRLGHSGLEITQRYLHTIDSADIKAADQMAAILYTCVKKMP